MKAAGILFATPTGRALFVRRAGTETNYVGHWALPGGCLEEGETTEQAAKREAMEEIGFAGDAPMRSVFRAGDTFETFLANVKSEFPVTLNDEHDAYTWASPANPPEPLHPGVKTMLDACLKTRFGSDMALDRASVRSFDKDGRLHVEMTNISKCNVCPYKGSEIPDAEKLGLDADKVYKLWRHPEELAKAASTFNNLPLLSEHVPVSADAHRSDLTIGSTGTDATFEYPYLRNSLVVWPQKSIDAVEGGQQKELSCAYHYDADMSPGRTPEGEEYDGVMRNIIGNHIAIVPEGRAGPDVVVGDAKPVTEGRKFINGSKFANSAEAKDRAVARDSKEHGSMGKIVLTRKATLVQGALMGFLSPRLAADAGLNLTPILAKLTAKNYAESKPKIAADILEATKGKLAKDAKLDDMHTFLDSLDKETPAEGVDIDPNSGLPMAKLPSAEDEDDDDEKDEGRKFLKSKLNAEDWAAYDAMCKSAMDAEEEETEAEKAAREKKEAKDKAARDKAAKDAEMDNKKAMDSSIKAAIEANNTRHRDMREAERVVRPFVGEIDTLAMDSADAIYKKALEMRGVKTEGVHPTAYRSILEAQPRADAQRQQTSTFAFDAASSSEAAKIVPDVARIKIGA